MAHNVRIEDGVVVGTAGGKYESTNPLAVHLIRQFDHAVSDLAAYSRPKSILEVGCGEGHVTQLLLAATAARILATDISAALLAEAEQALASDRVKYRAADVVTLKPAQPPPDLVVCCEVLEHLPDPQAGLEALAAQRGGWYLFSVPREPIWRILNVARGAYLKELGNSPGHLQHWSQRGFLGFIRPYFKPVVVRSPLPWTVVLCRLHDRAD